MDLSSLALMKGIDEKMHYLSQRQRVLAENIANANTPEYVPSDLKPFSFKESVGRYNLTMKTTDPKHLTGTLGSPRPFASPEDRRVYESSPDGNEVVIEEQIIKSNQTQMDYQLMSRIYEKQVGMIRYALRGSGSS
jgi:flagellar basal-body rod protein FlgB